MIYQEDTSSEKLPRLDSKRGVEIQQPTAADKTVKKKKQEEKMEDDLNGQVDYFMIKVPTLVFEMLQECFLAGLIFLFVLILVYVMRLWS